MVFSNLMIFRDLGDRWFVYHIIRQSGKRV
jgi:hypothetical protein